jgi:hypothetical protein
MSRTPEALQRDLIPVGVDHFMLVVVCARINTLPIQAGTRREPCQLAATAPGAS